jgi:hypothetical protein
VVPELQLREFCSVLAQCGLPPPTGACSESHTGPLPGVTYDAERCSEVRELFARHLSPADPGAFPVYRFLGRRYRVRYELAGPVQLSPARLAFLLDDLPLAAHLLTHFQKRVYTAEYLDLAKTRFRGSKAGTVEGEAVRVSGGAQEHLLFWLGRGSSKIGPWHLGGQAFVRFEFSGAADGRALDYRIRIVACPDNGFINAIMNMGLFKSLVIRQVREVVTDITEAARKLDAAGGQVPSDWTPFERARLAQLLSIP